MWNHEWWRMACLAGQKAERNTGSSVTKKILDRGTWINMWSKCHILFFVSHVNVHQKASTTEEVLTNQVNEVARLVTISQPLTQPPHNKHKGHMSTMATMAEMQAMCWPIAWTPTCQDRSSYCPLCIPNLPATETKCLIWHYSLRSTVCLVTSWLHWASGLFAQE